MPIDEIQKFSEEVEGFGIKFSSGSLAKQANGAVTIQLGETTVFVAVTAEREAAIDQDFFPLSVEYREKFCAAGRFPGGYVKREGRPSEREILTARLCDRPLRPLFPEGFRNGVQVVGMLLSTDLIHEPDVLMVNGASAALLCSDIPWFGPIGCVRIGEVNGQFIVNPTNSELYESSLDLLYVGNEQDMMMIEGSADQLPESRFLEALEFAQAQIQPIIAAQKRLAEKVGHRKREFSAVKVDGAVLDFCRSNFGSQIEAAIFTPSKAESEAALMDIRSRAAASMAEHFGEKFEASQLNLALEALQEEIYRGEILKNGRRPDGRRLDELRPMGCATNFLPRVHGVSLFQRGETQALVSVTLGTSRDVQSLDGITGGVNEKSFILHYNFPPFSVGETGRFGSPGRREIGHGALAERSLLPVIPADTIFPYSVRVVSEILESNGSSSMATVCGGTLALMDAGVPILAPVSGISIGLMTETDGSGKILSHVLLTDITGKEDHFGDMDFKIAGTANGITGFQLDLKIKGLPLSLVREIVERNSQARAEVLARMLEELAGPRSELKPWSPRMYAMNISPEKIGALIGPAGKNIRRICELTLAQIDVDADNSGRVMVFATSQENLERAMQEIEMSVADIEVGKTYRGIVRGIKEFGAFVECLPGKEGLVHISELDENRVERTEDICKLGDEIVVKCVGSDDKGRVRLSRRAALCEARGVPYQCHSHDEAGSAGRRSHESHGRRPERGGGDRDRRGGGRDRDRRFNSHRH